MKLEVEVPWREGEGRCCLSQVGNDSVRLSCAGCPTLANHRLTKPSDPRGAVKDSYSSRK